MSIRVAGALALASFSLTFSGGKSLAEAINYSINYCETGGNGHKSCGKMSGSLTVDLGKMIVSSEGYTRKIGETTSDDNWKGADITSGSSTSQVRFSASTLSFLTEITNVYEHRDNSGYWRADTKSKSNISLKFDREGNCLDATYTASRREKWNRRITIGSDTWDTRTTRSSCSGKLTQSYTARTSECVSAKSLHDKYAGECTVISNGCSVPITARTVATTSKGKTVYRTYQIDPGRKESACQTLQNGGLQSYIGYCDSSDRQCIKKWKK